MDRVLNIWNNLPKTVKVFFYLALSTILAEVLIELNAIEQTLLVRISAQLINLVIVFLQEAIPEARRRLGR